MSNDLPDRSKWQDIRMNASRRLVAWGAVVRHEEAYHLMSLLLGYKDRASMFKGFSDQDGARLGLLLGEHGYLIYKAWMVRGE